MVLKVRAPKHRDIVTVVGTEAHGVATAEMVALHEDGVVTALVSQIQEGGLYEVETDAENPDRVFPATLTYTGDRIDDEVPERVLARLRGDIVV